MSLNDDLKSAIAHALDGDWDGSHRIAQEYSDSVACWIHAVLHKIEGDDWNSRYWYRRTHGNNFEDYANPQDELREIARRLDAA